MFDKLNDVTPRAELEQKFRIEADRETKIINDTFGKLETKLDNIAIKQNDMMIKIDRLEQAHKKPEGTIK